MQRLYIANKNYSSWSVRAWLVLTAFDLDFEEILIRFDVEDPTFKQQLSQIHANAKVPVLDVGEFKMGLRKLSILKSMVTSLYESKNRCYSRSRIAEAKFRQIIRFFAMDFTASDTAKLTNISVRSIHTIYIKLHKKIAVQCEKISPFNCIVDLDKSYFDARRVRGKRGRGASSETIVFGLLKGDGNVY